MSRETLHTFEDVVREMRRYPLEAFEFLHAGLDFAVQRVHGPLDDALREIAEWMEAESIGLGQLPTRAERGKIPRSVLRRIEELGGIDRTLQKFNRHVSGEDLCWGLRDLALQRWGRLASTVLRRWGVFSTEDFGRMVFALVDHGLLQKQPEDSIDDFVDVFDFESAFDRSYRINLNQRDDADQA